MNAKHVEVVNKTPYVKQEASYRSGEPDQDVLHELLQTRSYTEILGVFSHNAGNSEDWTDGPIALNPLDIQTLHRLGMITQKGRITRRGECAIKLLALNEDALENGVFQISIGEDQVA